MVLQLVVASDSMCTAHFTDFIDCLLGFSSAFCLPTFLFLHVSYYGFKTFLIGSRILKIYEQANDNHFYCVCFV